MKGVINTGEQLESLAEGRGTSIGIAGWSTH
jgi:hypothetical protein